MIPIQRRGKFQCETPLRRSLRDEVVDVSKQVVLTSADVSRLEDALRHPSVFSRTADSA